MRKTIKRRSKKQRGGDFFPSSNTYSTQPSGIDNMANGIKNAGDYLSNAFKSASDSVSNTYNSLLILNHHIHIQIHILILMKVGGKKQKEMLVVGFLVVPEGLKDIIKRVVTL